MKYLTEATKTFVYKNTPITKGVQMIMCDKDTEKYKTKIKILKKIIEFPNELRIVK